MKKVSLVFCIAFLVMGLASAVFHVIPGVIFNLAVSLIWLMIRVRMSGEENSTL